VPRAAKHDSSRRPIATHAAAQSSHGASAAATSPVHTHPTAVVIEVDVDVDVDELTE
jgi:hypothetical protein